MKKLQRILVVSIFACGFLYSLVANMPAWLVGNILMHYSQQRLDTYNETGNFWRGKAMLLAQDADSKSSIPLMLLGWDIKLGLKQFVKITFSTAQKTIAVASLSKSGLEVSNLDVSLSLDQISPLLGSLHSLGLSGNVHVTAASIKFAQKLQGNVKVKLDNVGSGIAPVNPVGTYQVIFDLAAQRLDVSSEPDSLIEVSGSGNLNSLVLSSRIKEDQKEKLLQFMTVMGIPQPDGSYQMKVF